MDWVNRLDHETRVHNAAMRGLEREHVQAALTTEQVKHIVMVARATMYFCIGMAALIYSVRADARDLAYTANKAGGEIVLTDEKSDDCPEGTLVVFSKARFVRGSESADVKIFGCWAGRWPYVYIQWNGGGASVISIQNFDLIHQPGTFET